MKGEYITWYEFAKEIFAQAGMDVNVVPVTSDKFPAKAKRPHNSRMDKSKLKKNGLHAASNLAGCLEKISVRNPLRGEVGV